MRLGCLLPLVSVAMIIGGGQSVYTALKNRKPTEIGIDTLLKNKPDAKWLRITGGVLDTTNASYPSAFGVGDAKTLYIPLVPPDTDSSETTIQVLVQTQDKDLLDFTNEMREFEKNKGDKGSAGEFLTKNLSKLRVARPVEGLVHYGIDSGGEKERKIRKLYDNLADDAIILEEGEKPSMGFGFIMLLGGLGLGGVILMTSGKKPQDAPNAGPPPLPQS